MLERLRATAKRLFLGVARRVYQWVVRSPLAPILNVPWIQRIERRVRVAMPGERVVVVMRALERAGVGAWMVGGWGVDALVGEQTRRHCDLDLVLAREEETAAHGALAALGFDPVKRTALTDVPPLEESLRFRDSAGREVDLLFADLAALGRAPANVAVGAPTPAVESLPDTQFLTTGNIEGQPVPCLSAALQLALRQGYSARLRDDHDVEVLAGRLGAAANDAGT